MRLRIRPWQLALLVVAFCAALLAFLHWWRDRADYSNAALLARFPEEGAVHVRLDIQALREGGLLELLAGSRAAEETDYRRFVDSTGFDYREHLNTILAGFHKEETYFILRGRFDWDQIGRYVRSVGGLCRNGFCTVPGRTNGRNISYYAIRPDVLALAISPRDDAAYDLMDRHGTPPTDADLNQPIWLRVSASALQGTGRMPEGSRLLVTGVSKASGVTLSVAPATEGFEAVLRATFSSEADANDSLQHFEKMTGALRKFLVLGKQTPKPGDLTGVLSAGAFRREGNTVFGRWPIQRVFFESLAQGAL